VDGNSDNADNTLTASIQRQRLHGRLRVVRRIAMLDIIPIATMLIALFAHNERAAGIAGVAHAICLVALLGLTTIGALDRLWGWWYPALVLIAFGAAGALAGHSSILRNSRRPPGGPEASTGFPTDWGGWFGGGDGGGGDGGSS
jgi:hypothetical protein